MFIKIDDNGKIIESSTVWEEGYLQGEFEIDSDKFLFAKYVDGKIVYDQKKYKKHVENRTLICNLSIEANEIERWFSDYDRICIEKLRCDRLGVDCHHNMEQLDNLALQKIARLNEIKRVISQN